MSSFPKELQINSKVKYAIPAISWNNDLSEEVQPYKKGSGVANTQSIKDYLVDLIANVPVYASNGNMQGFVYHPFNIFAPEYYKITFTSDDSVKRWQSSNISDQMYFWQNQLNFAFCIASSQCGISVRDHLNDWLFNPLITSIFTFHVYFQTHKILREIGVIFPDEKDFNPENNKVDMSKVMRLLDQFQIPRTTDFRTHIGPNNGLGSFYKNDQIVTSLTMKKVIPGYSIMGYEFVDELPIYGKEYTIFTIKDKMSTSIKFIVGKGDSGYLDKVQQDDSAQYGWCHFILLNSEGITLNGSGRLNDSIMLYVNTILSAQTEFRNAIINNSSIGGQEQVRGRFGELLEDRFKSNANDPYSLKLYEKAINDANKQINFAIAEGLIMIPSNLVLEMGNVENYNNQIITANSNMKPGVNENINPVIEIKKHEISMPKPGIISNTVDQNPIADQSKKVNQNTDDQSSTSSVKPMTSNYKMNKWIVTIGAVVFVSVAFYYYEKS